MQDLKNGIGSVEQMQQTAIAARAVSSRTPPPSPPAENEKALPEQEESEGTMDL
jgi:hypothetical protein